MAEAGSAVLLGHGRAQPSHHGHALPQVRRVALIGLQHRAADVELALLVEVVSRGLLDELLVV